MSTELDLDNVELAFSEALNLLHQVELSNNHLTSSEKEVVVKFYQSVLYMLTAADELRSMLDGD